MKLHEKNSNNCIEKSIGINNGNFKNSCLIRNLQIFKAEVGFFPDKMKKIVDSMYLQKLTYGTTSSSFLRIAK